MTKYKYEFVKIKANFWSRQPAEDYHEIIKARARDGWRLVQIFAPASFGYGSVGYYESVFEKEDNF